MQLICCSWCGGLINCQCGRAVTQVISMGHFFLVIWAFLQWQRAGHSYGCLEPGPIITELGGICVHGGALPKTFSPPHHLFKHGFAKGVWLLQLQAYRLNFSEGSWKCQLEPKLHPIRKKCPPKTKQNKVQNKLCVCITLFLCPE